MSFSEFDRQCMQRALTLAARGQGRVEPNPMVGCVIARDDKRIAEGWHQRFGGPHAEIEALQAAASAAAGATMYVTLEPCCHHGKTPPCTSAVLQAGLARVVIAQRDPFPQVAGGGVAALNEAGLRVEVGLCEGESRKLNAPYLKLVETGRPWIIAKWAMTLDGKIASRTGDSKWISNEASRQVVHQLRGRVDAILVGRGTVEADDPLLTARPPGCRTATRVVMDSRAGLPLESQLVRTATDAPVLVVAGPDAPVEHRERLTAAGCEVFVCDAANRAERIGQMLSELGKRRMTNVLVEGGASLLGALLDATAIDEVHAFVAPKIVGGALAPSAIAGCGFALLSDALELRGPQVEQLGNDIYIHGRLTLH